MSYVINFSSISKTSINIGDDILDTSSTSLTIIGKSKLNWGEIIQENIIHILENFDSSVAPAFPTTGQLWSDNASGSSRRLRFYDAATTWKDVLVANSSSGLPGTGQYIGQLWTNTTTNQLHFWTGALWKTLASDGLAITGGTLTGLLTLSAGPTSNLHAATKKYVDDSVGGSLPLVGGTLTGLLTLSAGPTSNLHAATKKYVDDSFTTFGTTLGTTYLSLTGGTLTGLLTLSAGPTSNLHAATKKYVDDAVVGAGSGLSFVPVNKTGDTMTGLLTLSAGPTTDLHAATKKYVDDAQYLKLTGGTVTGAVNFSALVEHSGAVNFTNILTASSFTKLPTYSGTDAPSLPNQFVTKNYVDTNSLGASGGILSNTISYANTVNITGQYNLITRAFADARYFGASGGTMSGNLSVATGYNISVADNPTSDSHLVRKKYMDDNCLTAAGGNITGAVNFTNALTSSTFTIPPTCSVAPTIDNHLINRKYTTDTFLKLVGGTVTGAVSFTDAVNASTFTKLPTCSVVPSIDDQLVNKKYTTDTFLQLTGGTVTGAVNFTNAVNASTFTKLPTCSVVPSVDDQLVNKKYTTDTFLPLAGGTVTGAVSFTDALTASTFAMLPTCSIVPSVDDQLVNKKYTTDTFLKLVGGTVTGAVSFTDALTASTFAMLPTCSVTPTTSTQLVNKAYVDDVKRTVARESSIGFYHTDFENGINGTIFDTNITSGGTVAQYTSPTSGTNGLVQLSTETVSTGAAEITDGYGIIKPDGDMYMLAKIIIPIAATAIQHYQANLGLMGGGTSNLSGTINHKLSFEYDFNTSVNWLIVHKVAGTIISTTTTTIPVTFNTVCIVKIYYDSVSDIVTFYVNGTQAHQIVSPGIGATSFGFKSSIIKTNGTSIRTLLIDRVLYGKTPVVETNWNL